jgi:hypothetical protein
MKTNTTSELTAVILNRDTNRKCGTRLQLQPPYPPYPLQQAGLNDRSGEDKKCLLRKIEARLQVFRRVRKTAKSDY